MRKGYNGASQRGERERAGEPTTGCDRLSRPSFSFHFGSRSFEKLDRDDAHVRLRIDRVARMKRVAVSYRIDFKETERKRTGELLFTRVRTREKNSEVKEEYSRIEEEDARRKRLCIIHIATRLRLAARGKCRWSEPCIRISEVDYFHRRCDARGYRWTRARSCTCALFFCVRSSSLSCTSERFGCESVPTETRRP